jgi:hypothetical protein
MTFLRTLSHTFLSAVCLLVAVECCQIIGVIAAQRRG